LLPGDPEARDQKEDLEQMNKYELTLVLNGKLEEDAKAAALEKVQGYITRFNGTVTNVDDWGKKRFAYDIQKMKEGFYYFIKFESEDAACPNELEASLRIYEPVVRYLIVSDEAE
jgi:small subunit ribosomal protein S6